MTRGILRWGLIGGLALGAVTVLVGPDRVAAGLSQLRVKAQNVIDRAVDDPIALRRQLASLADKYPDRIAEVRGEIAEVQHEIGEMSRDCEVSRRVVALTTDDLGELKTLLTQARQKNCTVQIRFNTVRFDCEEAMAEARRINHVRMIYQDRTVQGEQQLALLHEQKDRLTEIHGKLDSEYASFQSQLWQLDRQIDAIERNERLIELIEDQQATLQSYDKFAEVGSLKQLEGKLAELRTVQQAQLEALRARGIRDNYQERAAYELETNDFVDPLEDYFKEIEVEEEADASADSMVWLGPVILE
ncbi:MAG: hypothetical protein ACYSXF_00060 [Planctomycetota bacterium]|jgi:chromosome segregation ATPase